METEKVVCCSILSADDDPVPQIYKHQLFNHDGEIKWPPEKWEEAHCWYCCHGFDWPNKDGTREFKPPVPIPSLKDRLTGKWHVFGLYCSWNCAKAELIQKHGYTCGSSILLLEQMATEVFNLECGTIVPAPPKSRLSYFYPGGLSIDEFRDASLNTHTIPMSPPLLSQPEIYEVHDTTNVKKWSIKGIRATPDKTKKESETKQMSTGLFDSYVDSTAASSTECTLINWMERA